VTLTNPKYYSFYIVFYIFVVLETSNLVGSLIKVEQVLAVDDKSLPILTITGDLEILE